MPPENIFSSLTSIEPNRNHPGEYHVNEEMEDEEIIPVVAHFSSEELDELDKMQGGPQYDPQTGLRHYFPLHEAFSNPETGPMLDKLVQESLGSESFAKGGKVDHPGRPHDPELEKLRREGRHGDDELAIITPFLLDKFSSWSDQGPNINPESGLPEFWSFGNVFKSIVRVAAPIVGAILGGPVGGALGGFLGSKATGQSTQGAFKNAFLGGGIPLAAMAAPAIMGAVSGSGAPGGLGGFLNIAGKMMGSPLSGNVAGAAMPGVVNASTVGQMLPAAAYGTNMAAGVAPIASAAPGAGGGILSTLLQGAGKALPMLGSAALMAKGARDEKKMQTQYERERREEREAERRRMGFDAPFTPREAFDYGNPEVLTPAEMGRGYIPRSFSYAAGGGAIRGHGKGQEDNITTSIPEDSYIIDASTVSDIGDGSTEAGFEELDRYFGVSSPSSSSYISKAHGGRIPAKVSNGEYELTPEQVTQLGHGSNERGVKILDRLVNEVRKKKRNSGQQLPPKAKSVEGYIKRIGGMHA